MSVDDQEVDPGGRTPKGTRVRMKIGYWKGIGTVDFDLTKPLADRIEVSVDAKYELFATIPDALDDRAASYVTGKRDCAPQ
jgi:hypothetical protein